MNQRFLFLLTSCLFIFTARSQEISNPKVFLDCRTNCDRNYLQQELHFVDFMRDRQDAEIFIQVISLNAADGGRQYTLFAIGKLMDTQRLDTIVYHVAPNVSANVPRREMLSAIKQSLLPYLLIGGYVDQIEYTIRQGEAKGSVSRPIDPWNAWTFSAGANGAIQDQSLSRTIKIDLRATANRTTEDHKFVSNFNYDRNESRFRVLDSEGNVASTIVGTNYSFRNRTLYVISLTDNWSAGAKASYRNSIFSNYAHSISVSPAIEYNIFPYAEASRRQFAIRYEMGGQYNDYVDTTFRLETSELLVRHNLYLDFSILQDWGQLDLDIFTNQFLNHPEYWSIGINPRINVNLIKGLAINIGSYYALTNDLIQLPKGELSLEELLLQNRQLNTSYQFNVYCGVNYRFGSSLNQVVNTRF